MATSRVTVGEIKAEAREAYSDGREMGFSHKEAVERATSLTGNATCAVEEWCEQARRRFDRETV
jgi:hypothetical protein